MDKYYLFRGDTLIDKIEHSNPRAVGTAKLYALGRPGDYLVCLFGADIYRYHWGEVNKNDRRAIHWVNDPPTKEECKHFLTLILLQQ